MAESRRVPDPGYPRRIVLLDCYGPSLTKLRGPLIAALAARGHQIVAMAPGLTPRDHEQLRTIGAEAKAFPVTNNGLNPFADLRSLRALTQLIKDARPDLVIAYTIKPIIYGAMAARRAGADFVAVVTGGGFPFTEGPGLRRRVSRFMAKRLYRRGLKGARLAVFYNEDDRRVFESYRLLSPDAPRITVSGSGVDCGRYLPRPITAEPRFLMMARLLGDKGVREYGADGCGTRLTCWALSLAAHWHCSQKLRNSSRARPLNIHSG